MDQIVPRWEWRTFARHLEPAIDVESRPRLRHVESSEVYVVSDSSEDNPKIRDELMDIKGLQSVNDEALEQWKPLMKAAFPLSSAQVAEVYRALDRPAPPFDRDEYSLADVLDLIASGRRTAVVRVDKIRNQYDVDRCTVEVADVSFDGDRYRTIAVEDADPAKVTATVRTLGYRTRDNVNFVRFIRSIKGLDGR
jgi:exopolyphosphatase/guanosine-5'-triphosphate,3'-diphosphate pyrophosphatase